MTKGCLISEMGHVAIRTSKIEETLTVATEILGLRITESEGANTYLAGAASEVHHEMLYIEDDIDAVDHFGFVARDADALVEARERIVAAGYPIISDDPLEKGLGEGFSFIGPDGFIFEIYLGMEESSLGQLGFGPDRYGHINMHANDVIGMRDFLVNTLGFMVSDVVGDGELYFLRCNPDHHGIALGKGRGVLHHHAWQAQSIVDLGKLNDRLDAVNKKALWGPVRHGAGHNIATYFAEPGGNVIELYTDLEQIYDDNRPPKLWTTDDGRWYSRWGVYLPAEFRDYGLFPKTHYGR